MISAICFAYKNCDFIDQRMSKKATEIQSNGNEVAKISPYLQNSMLSVQFLSIKQIIQIFKKGEDTQ